MNITLVMNKAQELKHYLDDNLMGNDISAYRTIQELYEIVPYGLRTQILIIHDDAMTANGNEEGFALLQKILFDEKYFSYSKVIFLNISPNRNNLSRYEFLETDPRMKAVVEIHTQDIFKSSDVLEFCKFTTKMNFSEINTGDIVVVQTERNKVISTIDFENTNIHKNTEFIGGFKKSDYSVVEKRFSESNLEMITPMHQNIQNLSDNIPNIPTVKSNFIEPKFLVTTGSKGSGVSSTTLSLGYTLAKGFNKKVMIIDLDVISLGLSFLVETSNKNKVLDIPINTYQLYNLKGKGSIDELKSFTHSASNLHCISLSMQLVREYGDITFIITSILSQIRNDYDHIILDIPIALYNKYYYLTEKFADGIVVTFTPFLNRTMTVINEIMNSDIINSKQFINDKVLFFNCGIPNANRIKIMSKKQVEVCMKNNLGRVFPTTNIFNLNNGYMCDMTKTIIEYFRKEVK